MSLQRCLKCGSFYDSGGTDSHQCPPTLAEKIAGFTYDDIKSLANPAPSDEQKPREWWIDEEFGHILTERHDSPRPNSAKLVHVVASSALTALQAKYDELISYLPKVPTQPYERELVQKLTACEAKLADAKKAIAGWGEDAEDVRKELYETKIKLDQQMFTTQNTFNHWQMALQERDRYKAALQRIVNAEVATLDWLLYREIAREALK